MQRLRRGDPDQADRIDQAVDRFVTTFRGDIRRLEGRDNEWGLRVGEWRVTFSRHPQERIIRILAVEPRQSAYRP